MTYENVVFELTKFADDYRALHAGRFFKTGKGEYGEGDQFIGITMPEIRNVCKNFRNLSIVELQKLLNSPIHEHRMAGVVIMADSYKNSLPEIQQELYELYLVNVARNRINNWDLVDVSAPHVVGAYLVNRSPEVLYELARNGHVWRKRTAMISTFAYLRIGDAKPTIIIAEILLHDTHDLIQKAVGWLLREMGKRVSEKSLTEFLDEHANSMPRTALRYAIERLSSEQKTYYMSVKNI